MTNNSPPPEHTVVLLAAPGTVLDGRWRIESRIGQGAMGSVFKGTDLAQQRTVAIKILAPEHCRKPKILARFEREAKLMTTLRHPNLVRFLGVGRRGMLPYIVMQFLEGVSLAEVLAAKGGKLSFSEMLLVLKQVAAGLSFVHHHGLVHRDVKPQNVMVGVDQRVTLLDFGVVRDKSSPGLTNPGALVGTPYYMAPEQISAKTEVDKRADVYALGAVAFELLVGKPPYAGSTSQEVLRAHRNNPVPDASALNPDVSPAVSAVLQRALAKIPSQRPQGTLELCADLSSAEKSETLDWHLSFPVAAWMRRSGKEPPASLGTDERTQDDESEVQVLPSDEVEMLVESERTADSADETDDHPVGELGELRVVTTLKGVTHIGALFIDGEYRADTPKTIALVAGKYHLRIEREGCVSVEKNVTVTAHQVTLIRLELKPVH